VTTMIDGSTMTHAEAKIHRSPAHAWKNLLSLPVSEELAGCCLSLPCSVGLTESDQERVIAGLVQLGN
jgi:dTDP-4-amino-4,6-dideoxygalactose transaminase